MIFTPPVTLVHPEFLRVHRVALHAFHCLHRVAVDVCELQFFRHAGPPGFCCVPRVDRRNPDDSISCPASVPQRFRPSVLLLCLLERLLISSLISLVLRSGILQLCIHHFTTAFLDTPNRSTFPTSFLTGLHPCSCPFPWSLW